MVPSDDSLKQHHHIEIKGPKSYWVHRFSGSAQSLGNRFSRVVFFSRDQQEAERFVRAAENISDSQ